MSANDQRAKISIIVPAYNAGCWIKDSLDSILKQTWKNIEIIVVNDGSTDNTEEYINGIEDDRIRYFKQENSGQAAACNFGLLQATGDYIKFFDADDLMNEGHLEQQLKTLGGSKTAVASCAWGKFFDGDPASAKFIPETVWKDMKPLDWLKSALTQKRDMMGGCLWLIPRELMERIKGWDERLSLNNDFEFSIKLLLAADRVCFTPEALLYYRSGIRNSLSKVFSKKSIEAVLLATQLGCSYLLNAEDSQMMRLICANRYQDWIYQIYPQQPQLIKEMEKEIKELGGASIKPQGGKVFHLLKKITGWKAAKKIQQQFYKLGYLKVIKK